MSPSQYSSTLIIKAEAFVKKLLQEKLPPGRAFHSIAHTADVVKACRQMGAKLELIKADLEMLLLAAWFHDTGYVHGNVDHEQNGLGIVEGFLSQWTCPEDYLPKIRALILATRMPQSPNTMLEKILCDADLHHLGSIHYVAWSKRLREEIEQCNQIRFSDQDWNKKNIQFFRDHNYFTTIGQELWGPQKEQNLAEMQAAEHAWDI